MGQLGMGIASMARSRASVARSIETIHSEVMEDAADEMVAKASTDIYMESGDLDPEDEEMLQELMDSFPDEDDTEEPEIERILAVDSDDIDIDDIVGVVEPED